MSERLTERERRALDDLVTYVVLHGDQDASDRQVAEALGELRKAVCAIIAERAKPPTDAIVVIRETPDSELLATPRIVERR